MPIGFTSLLTTSILAILLSTGWLQGLGQELAETSDQRLVTGLVIAGAISLLEIPVTERVFLHMHLIPIAVLFFRLQSLIKEDLRFMVFSSALFVGAVLFLVAELKVIEPIWNSSWLNLCVILFLLLCALGIAYSLQERACILVGGTLAAEAFGWVLYWQERQWIGAGEMVSLAWLSVGLLIIMHMGWKGIASRFQVRKQS